MTNRSRWIASAAGSLMLLGLPVLAVLAHAQGPVGSSAPAAGSPAAFASGSIQGIVRDETGAPVAGAVVSAVGASPSVAVTDHQGRFDLPALPPGPYLLRAHITGYVAPRAQMVDVRPGGRAVSAIALRRRDASTVLAAGVAGVPDQAPAALEPERDADESGSTVAGDQGELAWRLRHARRGILKDTTLPDVVLVDERPAGAGSLARIATGFFVDTPFSGQLNLLTTGSFDTPEQLFASDNLSRGIAYVRLGAPVGTSADWTIRGALNQADISSWILAGSYATRVPARHTYNLGMSYSTQRYDGGNPLALRDVTDGSRNAGAIHAFDTFAISPAFGVTFGARYARYDYLDNRSLLSPRVELTAAPAEHTRVSAEVSKWAQAPGAEEFLPPADSGIWLPPQRTFSSITRSGRFEAERASRVAVEVEHDIAGSTVALGAFRERVDDQLVTLFGLDMPEQPNAKIGHYVVGNAGDASATGCIAEFRTTTSRVSGSVAYSMTNALLAPGHDIRYFVLLAPTVLRADAERIHDVSTSIETHVPETSTRVLVLYRVSNGFARAGEGAEGPGVDSRFDVQVRQSLPFLNFTNAKWEMLVAVRNFFRDTAADQTVYDELLVVRPPKRIVGGVTMRF
ncbi:MAG: hypothetical protein A3H97_12200 [Acidobacteria bacterium RIFCSPLOWO2_02_FULL_65_29]|nr:MAG: hypothetical protein A3H97_12200 [Acidobacteria bacterium RIFCSPLOWO2_02_FULL_65_29]